MMFTEFEGNLVKRRLKDITKDEWRIEASKEFIEWHWGLLKLQRETPFTSGWSPFEKHDTLHYFMNGYTVEEAYSAKTSSDGH